MFLPGRLTSALIVVSHAALAAIKSSHTHGARSCTLRTPSLGAAALAVFIKNAVEEFIHVFRRRAHAGF